MSEVWLADGAMQDEQVACQYFIPAGENVWNITGLCCADSISHGGRNMGALKWIEVTIQHSVPEETQQLQHAWNSSMNCAYTDGAWSQQAEGSSSGSTPSPSEHVTLEQSWRTDSKGNWIWEWGVFG